MVKCCIRVLRPCLSLVIALSVVALLMPIASIFTADRLGMFTQELADFGLSSAAALMMKVVVWYFVSEVLEFSYVKICGNLSAGVYAEVQRRSMQQITAIPLDSIWMKDQGDLVNRITKNTDDFTAFSSSTLPDILSQAIMIVLVVVFLFTKNLYITCVYLFTLLVSIFSSSQNRTVDQIQQHAGKTTGGSSQPADIQCGRKQDCDHQQ